MLTPRLLRGNEEAGWGPPVTILWDRPYQGLTQLPCRTTGVLRARGTEPSWICEHTEDASQAGPPLPPLLAQRQRAQGRARLTAEQGSWQ